MSASNPFSFDNWLNHDGAATVDVRIPQNAEAEP
jgi:hypothetical protein